MRLLQITPGAGAMHCGNCFRDNALVLALRHLGHDAVMLPLYLPLTLDQPDQSAGQPLFFGGINVFLQQQSRLFGAAPNWLRNLLSARPLLHLAAGRAARTRAADVGALTESMLLGESGRQRRELGELVAWLKTQPRPDVLSLSNGLLLGLARRLRAETGAKVLCTLQGESDFLDSLPEPHRSRCWQLTALLASEADWLVAPSHYYATLMSQRLNLPAGRIQVVPNGIDLAGYDAPRPAPPQPPAIGFFARMCREKGLDLLVDAWLSLRRTGRPVHLRIGGSCGPADLPFVRALQNHIRKAGASNDVEFHPNLDRPSKIRFLQSLSVFSVPARCSEAFGLYLPEAMAAGLPLVQPQTSAFPEIVQDHGLLYAADRPEALAEALAELVDDPARAHQLGLQARATAERRYSSPAMAAALLACLK